MERNEKVVNLVFVSVEFLVAAVPLLELYGGGQLEFEFQRTISRLQEMQSWQRFIAQMWSAARKLSS